MYSVGVGGIGDGMIDSHAPLTPVIKATTECRRRDRCRCLDDGEVMFLMWTQCFLSYLMSKVHLLLCNRNNVRGVQQWRRKWPLSRREGVTPGIAPFSEVTSSDGNMPHKRLFASPTILPDTQSRSALPLPPAHSAHASKCSIAWLVVRVYNCM